MGGLLLIGTMLYGEGTNPFAFFIDTHGNVGIGTNAPKATLDVAGKLNVTDSASIKRTLTTGGNVRIGTTSQNAKLEVVGDVKVGNSSATCDANTAGSIKYEVVDNVGNMLVCVQLNSSFFRWAAIINKIPGVVRSAGRVWMDRNLGASRVATSSTDTAAYGDLYQWGRLADGHQVRNSEETWTKSSTDVPGHGKFIKVGSSPYDWKDPQNNSLWQGASGPNNPCPDGFRLPTANELEREMNSWAHKSSEGAFASPLKLVVAGVRYRSDGTLDRAGSRGYYWSSTVNGSIARSYARYLYFYSGDAAMLSYYRAYGLSVRCLMD